MSTSPPGYSSSDRPFLSRIGLTSSGGDYQAVPNDESLEANLAPTIKHTVKNNAIYIDRSEIRNAGQLETFIRQQQSPKPSFSLRFKGYRAPRSDESIHASSAGSSTNSEKQFQIFEFSVPLPSLSKSSSLLFSKANDVPCQRGQRSLNIKPGDDSLGVGAQYLSLDFDSFSSHAHYFTQTYDPISKSFINSSALSREKWNARVDKLMEPWLGLEERCCEHVVIDDEVKNKAERTLKQNLEIFLNDKFQSKWLICPQTVYGWDLSLIKDQIRSLIPEEVSATASHQPALISHINVSIDAPPPFLIIRVASKLALLSYSKLGEGEQPMGWLFFGVLAATIYNTLVFALCSNSTDCWINGNHGPLSTWSFWIINTIIIFFMYLSFVAIDVTSRRHDGVGLAWPLKVFKASTSKEDAREIEFGMEELEWVEKHKDLLRVAVKERRNGDLRSEWPEE